MNAEIAEAGRGRGEDRLWEGPPGPDPGGPPAVGESERPSVREFPARKGYLPNTSVGKLAKG